MVNLIQYLHNMAHLGRPDVLGKKATKTSIQQQATTLFKRIENTDLMEADNDENEAEGVAAIEDETEPLTLEEQLQKLLMRHCPKPPQSQRDPQTSCRTLNY